MKILMITPTSWQAAFFRAKLIETFQNKGNQVSVLTFDDEHKDTIESRGVEFHSVTGSNRSVNPFELLSLKKQYAKAIKEIKPDAVFTFMVKPNTFGVLAAHKAGVKNVYSMVEGAGDVFANNGLKWKAIRKAVCFLYKKAFRFSKKVFFLNHDDRDEFIERKLVKPEQCELIHGIGVDLDHYAYKPIKNYRTFLMVARMLKAKGVLEYCKSARIVKHDYPDAVFNYLGGEGDIKIADIQEYIDDGSINYLGTTSDVRPFYEDAALLLLSSYREGMPASVMEAESIGRGVIAFDAPGCREMVVNEYNGFLAPLGDYRAVADKVIWCIEHPEEIGRLGKNARLFVEDHCDSNEICERIVSKVTCQKENFQKGTKA